MPRRTLVLVSLLVAPAALAAAPEVVQFVDGRYLAIESHQHADGFIRLDLPGDARIVIPLERVETIERGRRIVYRAPAVVEPAVDPEPVAEARPASRARPAHRPRPAWLAARAVVRL